MVKILIADRDDILAIDSSKFKYPELEGDIFSREEGEVEEEEVLIEDETDIQTYNFKRGEQSVVSYASNSALVIVEKGFIDTKLRYSRDISNNISNGLNPILETYSYSDDEEKTSRANNLISDYHRNDSGTVIRFKMRHGLTISSGFGNISDPNTYGSNGSNMSFKSVEPNTLTGVGFVELERGNSRYGMRAISNKKPVLNNVWENKNICWGGTNTKKILQNSSNIVNASLNLLTMFIGSTFNTDLVKTHKIKACHLQNAIKRAYNRPKRGISQEDFEFVQQTILEKIGHYEEDYKITLNTLGVLGLCSYMNIDLTDLYI